MKATHNPPTTTITDPDITATIDLDSTPADLLRGAAIYLQRHGWTQHQFFELLDDSDGPFLPACASGAIMTAAYGHCLGNIVVDHDDEPEAAAAMAAMRVLADYLDGGYIPNEGYQVSAIDVIGDWNDDTDRTVTEVVDALNDAADTWNRTHHTRGAR
jgi:hypothetical protein